MKKRITIGIIAYITNDLHREFLEKTIASISSVSNNVRVVIYPNKIQDGTNVTTLVYPNKIDIMHHEGEPVSVAEAWNRIIEYSLVFSDYVLVANSDIIFHPQCIDNLVKFADENPDYALWSAAEHANLRTLDTVAIGEDSGVHPHFSCFMVNQKTVNTVGWFDGKFKGAYLEDLDYHLRILETGHDAGITTSAWFYHYGSRTIECDAELKKRNLVTHENNREYFLAKHGVSGDGQGAHDILRKIREGAEVGEEKDTSTAQEEA